MAWFQVNGFRVLYYFSYGGRSSGNTGNVVNPAYGSFVSYAAGVRLHL